MEKTNIKMLRGAVVSQQQTARKDEVIEVDSDTAHALVVAGAAVRTDEKPKKAAAKKG